MFHNYCVSLESKGQNDGVGKSLGRFNNVFKTKENIVEDSRIRVIYGVVMVVLVDWVVNSWIVILSLDVVLVLKPHN